MVVPATTQRAFAKRTPCDADHQMRRQPADTPARLEGDAPLLGCHGRVVVLDAIEHDHYNVTLKPAGRRLRPNLIAIPATQRACRVSELVATHIEILSQQEGEDCSRLTIELQADRRRRHRA
ncbi:MAG: hypothetical protein NTZ17_04285 [Phycisphaerae bacterium]|nr:hypothetical protein [Phycisphaerae bacterium]